MELAIEAELEKPMQCVSSEHLGKTKRLRDANGRYIEFCKSTFPSELDLRGLKIVVDCAHGAAYDIAPHVFHELGAEVLAIGNAPNGLDVMIKWVRPRLRRWLLLSEQIMLIWGLLWMVTRIAWSWWTDME